MKIMHCCLANFYIDDYGYQENILPKVHNHQGHDVAILASTETYGDNHVLRYVLPSSYQTREGIPITRLAYAKGLPHKIAKKLRFYHGIYASIDGFAPDIIFLHGCQFMGARSVVRYAKRHPDVRIFVDSHADFGNSAQCWLSRNILHKIIYRHCAKLLEPYIEKFYGVLPARVSFLEEVYGISPEKTELLAMGVDDSNIDFEKAEDIRNFSRASLDISKDDFVLITGGKIDPLKNITTLMRVVQKINNPKIKLLVFGTATEKMKEEFASLCDHPLIRYVGWVDASQSNDYFLASDLAVFPGTHSVLWEQAVGLGLPAIFRRWNGVEHVDLGGNCIFLETADEDELEKVMLELFDDQAQFAAMKNSAMKKGKNEFLYSKIAKKAIGQ